MCRCHPEYFDRVHHKRMFRATQEQNDKLIESVNMANDERARTYYSLSNQHIESIQTTAQLFSEIDREQNPITVRNLIDILDTQISEYRIYDNHFQHYLIYDSENRK